MAAAPSTVATGFKAAPRAAFLARIALAALAFAAPSGARAGSPLQFFFPVENSPSNTIDDEILVKSVFWDNDFEPVTFALSRPGGFNVIDPATNVNSITSTEVLLAAQRALEEWNDGAFSSFDFSEDATFTSFATVGLDGINMISFRSGLLNDANGAIAYTSIFFLEHGVDESALANGKPPSGEIEAGQQAIYDADGDGRVDIDLDGNGTFDLNLPPRDYDRGEIIETDIIFNQALVYSLWPEDIDDVPDNELINVPGSRDIQALLTHELGHAHGVGHTSLRDATMFAEHQGPGADFPDNPYDKRNIAYDDELGAGRTYPSFGSSKGEIKGQVIDGQFEELFTPGVAPCRSVADLVFVLQAPVYVGYPAPQGLYPDNVPSASGQIRLIGEALTGQALRFPAGSGGVTSLEPATTTIPNIDFNDAGEDLNYNCALDSGEDEDGDFQLDYAQGMVDGTFLFRGLDPRGDYVIYLDPDLNGSGATINRVQAYLSQFEGFDAEFYGGAQVGGPPDNATCDNPIAFTTISVGAGGRVENINIITNVAECTPTPSPTASLTPTTSPTASFSVTATLTPSPSLTPTESLTPSISPTPTPFNGADLVEHTIPLTAYAGETLNIGVTMRNSGTIVWDEAAKYSLGAREDACGLFPQRFPLDAGETVPSGQVRQFAGALVAPGTPQTCAFRLQMVQEFVEWFGEPVVLTINVVTRPNAAEAWERYE